MLKKVRDDQASTKSSISGSDSPLNPEQVEEAAQPLGVTPGVAGLGGATGPAQLPVRGWRQYGAAFDYPNYRFFWTGMLISNIGWWMRFICIQWLVIDIAPARSSGFWLGLTMTLPMLLASVFMPLGGVVADRFDRRKLLVVTNLLHIAITLPVAVLVMAGRLQIWHLMVMVGAMGLTEAMRLPAFSALVPTLVGRKQISNAVAFNAVQFQFSRIVGPFAGGTIIALFGPQWTLILFAVGSLFLVLMLTMIHDLPKIKPSHKSVAHHFLDGLHYLRNRPDLATMAAMLVVAGMLAMALANLFAKLARDVFERDETSFALMVTSFGIGACAAALLVAATSKRKPNPWRAYPLFALVGLCYIMIGFCENFHWLIVLIVVTGLVHLGAMLQIFTALQYSLPEKMRGRVVSVFQLAPRLGLAVGGVLAGVLADRFGVQITYRCLGAALLLTIPALALLARKNSVIYQIDAHTCAKKSDQ